MLQVRITALALLSAATLALLTACTVAPMSAKGSAAPTDSSRENNVPVMVAEYKATVRKFPLSLPSGSQFPSEPPKTLQQGVSEKGVGESAAYFYWLCSWEADYLKSFDASDAGETKAALSMIGKWESTAFVKQYWQDPDGAWAKGVLDPAKLGDPSGIQQDMQGEGCSGFGIKTP